MRSAESKFARTDVRGYMVVVADVSRRWNPSPA